MKTKFGKKQGIVLLAVTLVASSLFAGISAQAGVTVPRSEDTLVLPLPVSVSKDLSKYVELFDQGVYTPSLRDATVSLHYIMQGRSGDTIIEGASPTATFCDNVPNRTKEVLQISKENANGQLHADALIAGTTTNAETGADEAVSVRIPDEGTLGGSFGSDGSIRILRVCDPE